MPKIYITLAEIYDLDNGEMNFQERLRLQAEFLQALNPYFKGTEAGTVLPISATKHKPAFRLHVRDQANAR